MAKLDQVFLERLLCLVTQVAPVVNDQRVVPTLSRDKIARLLNQRLAKRLDCDLRIGVVPPGALCAGKSFALAGQRPRSCGYFTVNVDVFQDQFVMTLLQAPL